jgi:predicted nucleic acid-binding protein
MTTAIDSNVIAALWNLGHASNANAVRMLAWARAQGKLVISGPTYSELMAGPLRDEATLDMFCNETGIAVDWILEEKIWRAAGAAYRGFAYRRKSSGSEPPRRILADFLIGAHALVRGYSLLTLDQKHYAAAFPTLPLIAI